MQNHPPRGQVDARGQRGGGHTDLEGTGVVGVGDQLTLFGGQSGVVEGHAAGDGLLEFGVETRGRATEVVEQVETAFPNKGVDFLEGGQDAADQDGVGFAAGATAGEDKDAVAGAGSLVG